jgi:hypothetical protein
MKKKFTGIFTLAAMFAALTTQASAGLITFKFTENGNDLVTTAEGSFNLTGLSVTGTDNVPFIGFRGSHEADIRARVGLRHHDIVYQRYTINHNCSGLTFGDTGGSIKFADFGFGDLIGFNPGSNVIILPAGTGGQNLFGTATFLNTSLADWGLSHGDFASCTYYDSSGTNGGVIQFHAVPEPSALILVSSVLGLISLRRRR